MALENLYLVLHKVRGEPALDVAVRVEQGTPSDPGPWWIVSTSGHRAYPYCTWKVFEIADSVAIGFATLELLKSIDSVRDHYAINDKREEPKPPRRPAPARPTATADDLEDLLS